MKSSAILASVLIVAMGLGGIGIASAGSSRPGETINPRRDRNACFDPDFIRGFQTPGGNRVVVISGRNEAYELMLAGPCIGLESSLFIGIRSRGGGDICGPLDGDIIYENISGRRDVCRVSRVRHLEGEEAAEYVRKPIRENKKEGAVPTSSSTKW